jgi:pimeloyl-ACP methyl ester carboxylesterase
MSRLTRTRWGRFHRASLLALGIAACTPRDSAPPATASSGAASPETSSESPGEGASSTSPTPGTTTLAPVTRDYANVNGLAMYYEVHGDGRPIVVLHGGMCTIEACLGPILPVLAPGRRLIAVEQQAHGHTADIDRPLTFEQMADDTAALLRTLHVEKADVFGYSDGGNVALRLAMAHPGLVDRLAVFGTNANNEGLAPGLVDLFATVKAEDIPKEFRQAYEKAAPDPKGFASLVRKVMHQALAFKGWTPEELRSIRSPALVMVGDRDIVRPEHAVEMFRQLPNAQLAVLPGRDHFAPMTVPVEVGAMVNQFLSSPLPAPGGH